MRIYKTIAEAVEELQRDLLVRGETVVCNTYQDKELKGEDKNVKELIGVTYKVLNPLVNHEEAVKVIYKDEEKAKQIIDYIDVEYMDRTSGLALNPGQSYKVRPDMWMKFLNGENLRFAYTYPERIWSNGQMNTVLNTLRKDKGSRQAVLEIWQNDKDNNPEKLGGGQRVPCSMFYWFCIRHDELSGVDKLHCIYNMRSNDLFGHHIIDIVLAAKIQEWVCQRLHDTYPDLVVGTLQYECESLHAFQWDLKERVVF